MGNSQKDELRGGFDSRIKLPFCGNKVTSDSGLLTYCDPDDALKLTELGEDVPTDSRPLRNKQHLLGPLSTPIDLSPLGRL